MKDGLKIGARAEHRFTVAERHTVRALFSEEAAFPAPSIAAPSNGKADNHFPEGGCNAESEETGVRWPSANLQSKPTRPMLTRLAN